MTMQVRGLSLNERSSSYYYFEVESPQRAVDLARATDAARCTRVAYYEVRDDDVVNYCGLYTPPVLVAPAFPAEEAPWT